MELFGVGIGEAGLVLLITLLVVGPERFPQIAREGGKYYRMARRFTAEVTGDLRVAMKELENEVNEQTGDLKAVREIGEDVRSGVANTATDMDSITRATSEAASGMNSGETMPGAASPEGRREPELGPVRVGPQAEPVAPQLAPVTSNADPFARVRAVYSDYHQSPPPAHYAATAVESAPEAPAELDGDELSRQATETFAEFRKPVEPAEPAQPAVPYSPQQIVGVNPFVSADPPPSPPAASADTEDQPAAERPVEPESEPKASPPSPSTSATGT